MQPTSVLGQLSQSMAQGQPELNQISQSSPAGQPGLQPPPATPMPEKNPLDLIRKAAMRRGMNVDNHPQMQSQPNAVQPAMMAPQQPQQQVIPKTEAELLISAITKRLDHHSKVTEKLLDSFLPQHGEQNGATS